MAYRSSDTCQCVFPGGWNQLSCLVFHHGLSKPLPLESIISKPEGCKQHTQSESCTKKTQTYHFLHLLINVARLTIKKQYLVLSEIHSSLISSLRRGRILITSPPRVLTMMLLPTASRTSMVSVFLENTKKKNLHIKAGEPFSFQCLSKYAA